MQIIFGFNFSLLINTWITFWTPTTDNLGVINQKLCLIIIVVDIDIVDLFSGGFLSVWPKYYTVIKIFVVCWHLSQCFVTDNLDLVLRLPCSLADYKLQEVTLVCNQSHPVEVSVSTVDIMSLQRDSTNPAYRNTLVRPTYSCILNIYRELHCNENLTILSCCSVDLS